MARKRMDPAMRAELILNTALRLFAERHFGTVSMRDIAEACGINVGLIYYYYANKNELLRRALGYAIAQLHAGYPEEADPTPPQELTAWFRMHVPIAPMVICMVKIMADYAASNIKDEETDRMIREFYRREQEFLESCLRRGVNLGMFRKVNIEAVARAFSLQLDGIFYASQARGDDRITQDIEFLCSVVDSVVA